MKSKRNPLMRSTSSEDCGPIGGCPGVYELVSKEECVLGSCPGVYKRVSEEECIIGSCSAVFDGIEKDYLIIGSLIENPKDFGLEKKVGKGEVLIRVPKKIIDNMKG